MTLFEVELDHGMTYLANQVGLDKPENLHSSYGCSTVR